MRHSLYAFARRDGKRLVVLRPAAEDVEELVALAGESVATQDQTAYLERVARASYTFVGYVGHLRGRRLHQDQRANVVLDAEGRYAEALRRGDSFWLEGDPRVERVPIPTAD